jgi:hypothetical protein
MVRLWEALSEMDKNLNKALDIWEVTEEHLIGYGGVFREDINGPQGCTGKGKGSYKDIEVNMDEVKVDRGELGPWLQGLHKGLAREHWQYGPC